MNLTTIQIAAIDEELFAGNIITAIRHYRGFTGASLYVAKSFVDCRLKELRNDMPSRFPAKPTPPELDSKILQQIESLPECELQSFKATLKKIEKILYGLNYAVTLSVSAARLPTAELPVNELMRALYPESIPYDATIMPVSSEELVAEITECLAYEGDMGAGPQLTARRRAILLETMLPEYLRQLNVLAPLEASSLYSYSSDVGIPGYCVFWFFAYLIHHHDTKRCFVITGISSD